MGINQDSFSSCLLTAMAGRSSVAWLLEIKVCNPSSNSCRPPQRGDTEFAVHQAEPCLTVDSPPKRAAASCVLVSSIG
jgi:hypothetical protein